jgi:predicted transcriptional regulator
MGSRIRKTNGMIVRNIEPNSLPDKYKKTFRDNYKQLSIIFESSETSAKFVLSTENQKVHP